MTSTKQNRSVPQLRFPEFEGEWVNKRFNDICERSKNKHNPEKDKTNYECVELESIEQNSGKVLKTFDSTSLKSIKNKFYKGEVLFGKLRPYLKKYVLADFDGVCSSEIWVLQGKIVSNPYLYYLVQSNKFNYQINLTIGSKMPRADWSVLSNSKFYISSSPIEQTRIATFLTAVDKRINLLQKKKAELEQYKKGVMQKIFAREIRFKDENGNDFPDWEEKKLGDLGDIRTGTSNRQDSGLDGDYTFFDRSEDIRTSNIFLFDCEAIIVGGEGSDFVPKYFIGKFDLHQRTYAIMNFKNADGKYLFYYIYYFRRYFLSQAVGSTVKSLRLPMFQKMPINTPSIKEQQKIASFLSAIDKKIEKTEQQIEASQQWKQGLLQKMFV